MPYGQNADFGIAFQTSFDNTASVNSTHWLPIMSESVTKKIPGLISESMRGIFEEGDSYEGPHTNEGDVEIEAASVPLGTLLSCMFEETANVNSGSVYTRTFKPRTADWDDTSAGRPFTIYKYLEVGSAMQYSNMNGSSLELSISNGEFFKAKMSVVGGSFSQIAATTPSYPDDKIWTWDTVSVSFGGTANADIENLTITIDEAIEAKHTLNNAKVPSHTKHTGFRTVSIDGTIKFDTQDEYQAFLSQSERQLLMHFEGVTAIQSGYNESITIDLPKMRYDDFPPQATGPGEVSVGFTARGKYSVDSATLLEITHVSDQAAY